MPDIEIWPYDQMVYAKPTIHALIILWFWNTKWSPNQGQTNRPSHSKQKKKRNSWIKDIAVPANDRVKLKESEKKDTYLDHARELKKL